jgi:hypothetical protein
VSIGIDEEEKVVKLIRTILIGGLVAVALTIGAIQALATFPQSGVKSFTGCLSSSHVIVNVAKGNSPSSPCAVGQTTVHLSGGDITSVTAGTGLNISGGDVTGTTVTDGAVTLTNAIHLVSGPGASCANGSDCTDFAGCAANEIAVGGGVRFDPVSFPASGLTVELAGPSFRADGTAGSWRVDGHNASGITVTLTAWATCMKA